MKRIDIDRGRRGAHPLAYAGAGTARRILVDDLGRAYLEGDLPSAGLSRDASPPSSVPKLGEDRDRKAT